MIRIDCTCAARKNVWRHTKKHVGPHAKTHRCVRQKLFPRRGNILSRRENSFCALHRRVSLWATTGFPASIGCLPCVRRVVFLRVSWRKDAAYNGHPLRVLPLLGERLRTDSPHHSAQGKKKFPAPPVRCWKLFFCGRSVD